MTTVNVGQLDATTGLLDATIAPRRTTPRADFGPLATIRDEAFMTLLLSMSDTRKRIIVLSLLSFLAMC